MASKDALARGARSASYFNPGKKGDEITLLNVAKDEPETPVHPFVTPAVIVPTVSSVRKVYRPLGKQVLVRRAESKTEAFGDMSTALAAQKPGLVLIQEETNKEVPAEGIVIRTGPDVTTVVKGDYVSFGKYSGVQFSKEMLKTIGETDVLLMSVEEILGVLEDETEIEETFEVSPSSIIASA